MTQNVATLLSTARRRLLRILDASSAQAELKWMRDAAKQDYELLQSMVQRRCSGEPLQYILGDSICIR